MAASDPPFVPRSPFQISHCHALAEMVQDPAAEAVSLIKVQYEPLPFVIDPEEALKPTTVKIFPQGNQINGKPVILNRGDVAKGFRSDLLGCVTLGTAVGELQVDGHPQRAVLNSKVAFEEFMTAAAGEDLEISIEAAP